jgi:hypothetical protein
MRATSASADHSPDYRANRDECRSLRSDVVGPCPLQEFAFGETRQRVAPRAARISLPANCCYDDLRRHSEIHCIESSSAIRVVCALMISRAKINSAQADLAFARLSGLQKNPCSTIPWRVASLTGASVRAWLKLYDFIAFLRQKSLSQMSLRVELGQ